MCGIKCSQIDCFAFRFDKTSRKCELGSVVDNGGDNNTWIDVYRKLDENGAPAVAPLGKYSNMGIMGLLYDVEVQGDTSR